MNSSVAKAILPIILTASVFCVFLPAPFCNADTLPTVTGKEDLPTKPVRPTLPVDEFSWLEGTRDPRALAWVERQNSRTFSVLKSDPRYLEYYRKALGASRAVRQSRIPELHDILMHDNWIYQIWKDARHPRGILRRTRTESYAAAHPQWESLLDVDALSTQEGRQYTLAFALLKFQPSGKRCLIPLSEGGAPVVSSFREFDLIGHEFVKDGFVVPLGAAGVMAVDWWNDDTLWVATDFGPTSLDHSSLPLTVRSWTRGESFALAKEIFRQAPDSALSTMAVPYIVQSPPDPSGRADRLHLIEVYRGHASDYWIGSSSASFERIKLPQGSSVWGAFDGQLIVQIRSACTVAGESWPAGSVLAMPIGQATADQPTLHALRTPVTRESIDTVFVTRSAVLMGVNHNVRSELWRYTVGRTGWQGSRLPFPEGGVVRPILIANPLADVAFANVDSLVIPPTEFKIDADGKVARLFTARASFNAEAYVLDQYEATSSDGTSVPYFVAHKRSMTFEGQNPTVMQAYGAYGLSQSPSYSSTIGALWLAKGGVYVIANVRGGGELGPAWHVPPAKRNLVYDDFAAVAQDLIRRKVTSSARLGIIGGSAGGILMGVMVTQHSELFHAAVIEVPVLDLFRLDLNLGGAAAQQDEFGSVDAPAERELMENTSPFQQLHKTLGFPTPFIITSTTDDNVHPAQPRRFAAKAESLGLPFIYFETKEGGHGMASTPQQQAELDALIYIYFKQRLMDAAGYSSAHSLRAN